MKGEGGWSSQGGAAKSGWILDGLGWYLKERWRHHAELPWTPPKGRRLRCQNGASLGKVFQETLFLSCKLVNLSRLIVEKSASEEYSNRDQ